MKELFSAYYRPTEKEFTAIMRKCTFVLDTNVLFHLYRYSDNARSKLVDVLRHFSDRLWLPYHVAYEYQRGRAERIIEREIIIDKIISEVKKVRQARNDIGKDDIFSRFKKDAFLNLESLITPVDDALMRLEEELQQLSRNQPDWIADDPIRSIIDELFDKKIGSPFSESELEEFYKDCKERYEKEIPPGYKDKDKPEPDRYGDFIIWKEIIAHAEKVSKPIIFISDDKKEDWWWQIKGKTLGPRIELVQEMRQKAGVQFYMYSVEQFIRRAQEFLKLPQADFEQVIEETRDLQKENRSNRSYFPKSLQNLSEDHVDYNEENRFFVDEISELDFDLSAISNTIYALSQDVSISFNNPKTIFEQRNFFDDTNTRINMIEHRLVAISRRYEHILNMTLTLYGPEKLLQLEKIELRINKLREEFDDTKRRFSLFEQMVTNGKIWRGNYPTHSIKHDSND